MYKQERTIKNLEAQLKFASRASAIVNTPQCKELFRWMMDDMGVYNNKITGATPLSHDEYLLVLGKLQGLKAFINKIKIEADKKEEYAERLKELRGV